MKKIILFFVAFSIAGSILAGGLVTNTNHSAYMTRMMSREASTGIDAVFYNPAGLTKLGDGFHFSLNNQIIKQTKTITNSYLYLANTPVEYTGSVSAPFFPGIYAAFKKGKLVFSAGVNPIGGGGGAEYAGGLPSFELQIADLVPLLVGFGLPTTQYSADVYFKGSSIYLGYQANVSYEINNMVSVALGARFVSAKNTYEGHLTDIMANPIYAGNPTGAMILISPFFTAIGEPAYAAATADAEVEVAETGTGFTPIVSVNFSPMEMLNVAVKYEFATKLTLVTEVTDSKDGGIFVDGEEVIADMPAFLSVGASFKPMDKFMVMAGINYFFDKNTDYDKSADLDVAMIDKNFMSYTAGVEYKLNNLISLSVGYGASITGVNSDYQSDLRYSLNTKSFCGGIGLSLTPMIDVNLGAMFTMYDAGEKTIQHILSPGPPAIIIPANEKYDTETMIIGIGIDLHF